MNVQGHALIGVIFVALSVVLVGIAFRDYLKGEGKLTIARKTWLRMAFVFAGVGIGLFLLQAFV
jgi:hypothetical protein